MTLKARGKIALVVLLAIVCLIAMPLIVLVDHLRTGGHFWERWNRYYTECWQFIIYPVEAIQNL